ncbi:MAG TPA: hypothetical protein VL974_04405 [Magnetospirillum sp.]|jgi:hypothetical protein|nr:hypothetical protein [Magnetospirillum sp.]
MTERTVAFIVQLPVTARDRQRYCMDALRNRGFTVRVVDLGPLLLPDLPADRSHYAAQKDLAIDVVKNWTQLRDVLAELGHASAFALCPFVGRSYTARAAMVLRLMSRQRVPYGLLLTGASPSAAAENSQRPNLIARVHDLFRTGRLPEMLVMRTRPEVLGIPRATLAVYGGRNSMNGGPLVGLQTRSVLAHSADWDIWQGACACPFAGQRDVAVFIDQYLPFHADLVVMRAHPIPPDFYYASLRRLFDRIETEMGLEVVVAAHPRSDYETRAGLFGARRILKGDTAPLVRESRLVLTHHSAATNFAALWMRPVMFLTSHDIRRAAPLIDQMGRGYAQALNRPQYTLEDVDTIDLAAIPPANETDYARFIEEYIKQAGSPHGPLEAILAAALNDVFQGG